MDGKTCDLLLPEDTSGHYIWLVWDFKDSLIAIFKIYSIISWRQDYRHISLMSLGLAVKTRLRPPRNSSEESFQNKKVSMESCLFPVAVVNNTMVTIVLFRVKHKRAPNNIMNVQIKENVEIWSCFQKQMLKKNIYKWEIKAATCSQLLK